MFSRSESSCIVSRYDGGSLFCAVCLLLAALFVPTPSAVSAQAAEQLLMTESDTPNQPADIVLTGGTLSPNHVAPNAIISGWISGSWWTEAGAESTVYWGVVGFRDSNGVAVGEPIGVSGLGGTLPLYPGNSFTDSPFSKNGFNTLTAPSTSGTYSVWVQMVAAPRFIYAPGIFTASNATVDKQYHKKIGDVVVGPPANINLTSPIITPSNVAPGGAVSGMISGNWWTDPNALDASWYVVAGFRNVAGAAIGEPVGVAGMQGVVLPLDPGLSFAGNAFSGLTAPNDIGAHSVWILMVAATSLSDAIAAFKSETPSIASGHHEVGQVMVCPPSDISLTTKTVTTPTVAPGGTITGAIGGNWWTDLGSETAVWYTVAGLRDNAGSALGEPVAIGGMEAVTLPVYLGETFTNNGFGSLIGPNLPGTYAVWVQMVQSSDLAGAKAAFKAQTATADKQYHRKVGDVTVAPLSDIMLTGKSVVPTTVSSGGSVVGAISGLWWTQPGFESSSWFVVAGFRDSSGAAVGEPVGVTGMLGTALLVYPGQPFTNNAFDALLAPTAAGTYGVWVQMVPTTDLAGAISAFKSQTVTAEAQFHRKVGDVTVAATPVNPCIGWGFPLFGIIGASLMLLTHPRGRRVRGVTKGSA